MIECHNTSALKGNGIFSEPFKFFKRWQNNAAQTKKGAIYNSTECSSTSQHCLYYNLTGGPPAQVHNTWKLYCNKNLHMHWKDRHSAMVLSVQWTNDFSILKDEGYFSIVSRREHGSTPLKQTNKKNSLNLDMYFKRFNVWKNIWIRRVILFIFK